MHKQQADALILQYLPKIYGFAIKKTYSYAEAEELSAEIVAQVYWALLSAEEIHNTDGYIWKISRYVYAKFVSSKKNQEAVFLDGIEIPDDIPVWDEDTKTELDLLRREIAFLTQTRRKIVYAFYYENKPISAITKEMGIPEGTVKWHLNKARNDLKEGFDMERKIGKLGIKPIEAINYGHGGSPGTDGGPERYLDNKLNLNIVYSVYYEPKTLQEIAQELGITPVYIEDAVKTLEENGFLVRQPGNRYTTYVRFNPETYSLEQQDRRMQKQMEIAKCLVKEYVPLVREAVAKVENVYIPSGNRELLEAAAIFYAVLHNCATAPEADLSKYYIQTKGGGSYIAFVDIPSVPNDPDYVPARTYPPYGYCGSMWRSSDKYPGIFSWSCDTRYSSRKGNWGNNYNTDYEYVYEVITGTIEDTPANKEKFDRLRAREYLGSDNKIKIMVVQGGYREFFEKLPVLDEKLKKTFADDALEYAMLAAKDYPPQMRELIVSWNTDGFVGAMVALMVLDILYENGTFRPLTKEETITANLLMFSDKLPE